MLYLISRCARVAILLSFLMLVGCALGQGITHSGRFVVFPKGGSFFPDDSVDTLYAGTPQNMIVTITLRPSSGDMSSIFLVVDGNDIAELTGVDEDSRTFKLEEVNTLAVRFGAQDNSSTNISGDYNISLMLR